jgi:hypothetical protein
MNGKHRHTPITIAVLVALGSAPAVGQEMLEIDDLVNPQSSVRAGVGYIDSDNRWFGRYRSIVDTNEEGAVPLFDLDYVTRDNETGTWVRARVGTAASNGAAFEYERQGDWGAKVEVQRIETTDPLEFNTQLSGIGSN